MDIQLSIPLDKDGFIEMECDFCKNRFMLHESTYSGDTNLHFFCPVCGLPNDINTFYCPEVLELARQKTLNHAYEMIQQQLGSSIRKFNKNGLVRMSLEVPKQEPEKELYAPSNDYVQSHKSCCRIDVKTLEIDNQIGIYCPICGGSSL